MGIRISGLPVAPSANTGDQLPANQSGITRSITAQQILDVVTPANHTHALARITDVTMTAANLNSLDDGVNSTLHFHNTDRDRANHTGTQLAATISNFNTAAQTASVTDAIVDGVTTVAPSQNAVFDALALKSNRAGDTITGPLIMDNQQPVRFRELTASGVNFVSLQGPTSLSSDVSLFLPSTAPANGDFLQASTGGQLTWSTGTTVQEIGRAHV